MIDIKKLPQHRQIQHGVKNIMRSHVSVTHCIQCLREFWTRSRLLHHLNSGKSNRCKQYVQARSLPITNEERDNLDLEESERVRLNRKKGLTCTTMERPWQRRIGCIPHRSIPPWLSCLTSIFSHFTSFVSCHDRRPPRSCTAKAGGRTWPSVHRSESVS